VIAAIIKPAYVGPHGRVYEVPNKAWEVAFPNQPHSAIGVWFLDAPWCHPMWKQYYVSLIHLGHVEGLGAATVVVPGATHELLVFALDPQNQMDPTMLTPPKMLTPQNLGQQFQAESPEKAKATISALLKQVCHGTLSVDSDYRRVWAGILLNPYP